MAQSKELSVSWSAFSYHLNTSISTWVSTDSFYDEEQRSEAWVLIYIQQCTKKKKKQFEKYALLENGYIQNRRE